MKKIVICFCLMIICLSFTMNFAQSRRVSIDANKKSNQRETKPVETPTPPSINTTAQSQQNANGNAETDDTDIIKVDSGIVSLPVKVLDRNGRFIGGLKKGNFKVLDDNAEQEIAYFSNEQQPFTVALVLDMSYSAKFKAEEIQAAAFAFINQLRPNDKVMVVSFDQEVYVQCEPTNDRKVLQKAIRKTKISYGTSLYDAMDLVINEKFKKIAGRKAIVLFSDGVDTSSLKSDDLTNLSDALELDALIYPIEYDTFNEVQAMKNKPIIISPTQSNPFPTAVMGVPNSKGTTAEEYKKADEYLNEMANRTGGRLYKASTIANLSTAFSNIASELREYYSLGFYPKDETEGGKKHKIKVRVDRPGVVVKSRDSYSVKKVKSRAF
ncbi:MAG: VWA domain-containing protein [Actinomycetota bacterium]